VPVLGERVECRVRRGVAALSRTAQHSGQRREQHELVEVEPGGEVVQGDRRVEFRAERDIQLAGGEGADGAVVDRAGGVEHRGQRTGAGDLGEHAGERGPIGHVARDDVDPRAQLRQVGAQRG